MNGLWSALRAAHDANGRRSEAVDWWTVALFVAFCVLFPWRSIAMLLPAFQSTPFATYENALREAAIKVPKYAVPLQMLDGEGTHVQMVAFKWPTRRDGTPTVQSGVQEGDLWVSKPAQLKALCAGAADPILALQQILGLPPASGPRMIFELSIAKTDLVRPCLSGPGTDQALCAFKLLEVPQISAAPADAANANTDAKAEAERRERDESHLRFIVDHMWKSYRSGFSNGFAANGDYPYDGFPFTGMGWTYNWNPAAASPVGVTEFVVRKKKSVEVKGTMSPAEFCKAS